MIENFAYLIDEIGFIPNGNRTYYCTRSQPPFFVLMVELLAEVKQDRSLVGRYLAHLEKEYEYWMSGAETLEKAGDAVRRVVRVEGGLLNRYWDDASTPRPESYIEDLRLQAGSGREPSGLYRDLRAACESGWDFSSRWLDERRTLASNSRTRRALPAMR
jgi:alpha,alpha-trehalase